MDFKQKELIIFDLDGTLINSIPDLTLAINKMLKHYDFAPITVEQVVPIVGNGAKLIVERAIKKSAPDKNLSENFLTEALGLYYSAYREATCELTYMYPGVAETLEYLHAKGYKMAICTNKPFDFIEAILEKLKIKQFFKCWIGEDSLSKKKPDATPLLHLADETNTITEKSIMVGDSKNDILAAKNAGMDSIGLTYGYNYNQNISDYNPTVVADNFADLQKLF